ncbi:MAG: ABC transporter ATP-binding protein/permease [Ruminococcaceae bacterium]|nr:ABC transporter ATP-binding protein/permease [Oscillospiraceae bacterium]
MLTLKGITKDYITGDSKVAALKGVDLQFRSNEFVSILGQSGCGKTTLLNIIGGLDKYTSGDLFINGKSTKNYKDRDWDNYRNHSVGFVFQSYNLIPHQTVLSNVELALTLSGVSKSERRRRAKEALEKVGLGDQLRKKPSEMSGGQMQRVAIARAIVNNPDIILADEPTGALDTETSVQVMKILKEISEDRLVIMVTHNPELAAEYSTRIIRMLDGVILSDSKPLSDDEIHNENELEKAKAEKAKTQKMPSMSFFTSFGLSLNNLFTKKGRTALTSFAGSIGIIGIALIFAVSQGTTAFIDSVQEETLSSYPLTIESQNLEMTELINTFMGAAESSGEHEKDAVYEKSAIYEMMNALNSLEANENDLKAFKAHLEKALKDKEKYSDLIEAVNGIQYTYDFNMLIYTQNVDGQIIHSDSSELMADILRDYFGMDFSGMMSSMTGGMSSSPMMSGGVMGGSATLWQEMLTGTDGELINPLIPKQYDLIHGSWPNDYNEILLVVDENNEVDDMTLYALGLKSKAEIEAMTEAVLNKEQLEIEGKKWSYKEICEMEFKTILNSACYTKDEKTGLYTDLRDTEAGLKYLYANGIPLKVTGIIRPKEGTSTTLLSGSICYTKKLTDYVVEKSKESSAIKAQLNDDSVDIFTGLPFKENSKNLTNDEKKAEFKEYLKKLDKNSKADTYVKIMSIPEKAMVEKTVNDALKATSRDKIEATLIPGIVQQTGMSKEEITEYLKDMKDEELFEMYASIVEEQFRMQYAAGVAAQLMPLTVEQKVAALDAAVKKFTSEQFATYYDEVLEFSNSSYDTNLVKLGYVELDTPSTINIYASSFENKDIIEAAITDYNKSVEDLQKISYTDYLGIMMSSITTIINAITYVLMAFVAVSLIVSSIMIGVITLISVQERTKEIGILRAIGASKRNVSSMFNAETIIIGFTSGLLGVVITYLLCIPINIILEALTGLSNLKAVLPIEAAILFVAISVILTMFSGIIPSRSAAKKDPVIALRTE